MPLVFLVVQAVQVGWAELQPALLFRSLTAMLVLEHGLAWSSSSTVLCAVVGTLAAWFVERTDLPGRRLFAILVVIPLGIPDFVVSFGWRAIFPAIGGFWAAVLVMTLAVYPAGLPAGGGQPAHRRPGARRGGAQPRPRAACARSGR